MSAFLPNLFGDCAVTVHQWTVSICTMLTLLGGGMLVASGVGMRSAQAHGIAGNRLFPGTLSFEDPAVADEFALAPFTNEKHPANGSSVVDNSIGWSFIRLLTPTLGVGVDGGWIHRDRGELWNSAGFDATSIALKWLLYKNEEHELMVSGALAWGIGGSGALGVDAAGPHTVQPGIFHRLKRGLPKMLGTRSSRNRRSWVLTPMTNRSCKCDDSREEPDRVAPRH